MTKPSSIDRAAGRVRSGSVFLIVLALASSWLVVRAEIPQVASGTWVTAGQVGTIPTGAASVGLSDGRLLVAGGQSDGVPSSVVATYDPASGTWAAVGTLNVARAGHTATVLKDGRVLIAGGANADGPTFDIEIFNPSSGTSVHAGDMTLPRVDHAAATLKDGRVLIVGGSDAVAPVTVVEVFDPETGLSTGLAAALSTPRVKATATTLLDGHVLIAGGSDGTSELASAEIFEPASGSFFATGAMQAARSGHVAVLLPDNNQVLVAGGTTPAAATYAELYADWRDGFSPAPNHPSAARTGAVAAGLQPYDLALVVGGGPATGEYYGYATVKTDKDDYQPGETVTISGSGWQPGETVTLRVSEDADTHTDWNLTAVANEQGQIVNREFYPRQDEQFQHLGMRFYVMATGAASQALTTFTDGALKIKSANGRHFDFTYQRFTDLNCTSGGGSITTETADTNGFNLNTANGESWRIIANLNANAPNASSVFSSWSNPNGLTITPNLTSRTICVQGFQSGNKDLIGNYVANTPPVANNDAYTTNEDTALTVAAPGVLGNDTDANGNSLTAVRGSGTTGPSNGTLTFNADGSFTYTPNANFNGSDSFTYFANDGFADSNTAATVTITVNAVNDAPTFVKGPDQTVLEDAGAQSVTSWATSISAGPNEGSQTATFSATNNNNSLFSVQPSISPTGTLTYAPAANAYGSATVTVTLSDDGGTANGGVDTSAAQTFTINVTPVNDAPGFMKGADQTVLEDAGLQTVTGWATSISAGPNETQTLTFTTSNNNTSLFSVQPAISATGTLTYTPAANANGAATVTVTLSDDGGTADGGVNTSAPQTFTITVTAVNDAPSFTKGANETVLEDSGARTVSNWPTNISAGPPDENTQTVTFTATNDNNPLFSVQPAISSTGTLTYTPAANAFGSATVTLTLKDNGGTANGGADTSAPQTFLITVTPVNDAPSFTKGSDQTVNEDAGAQTVTAWATAISAGPANESSQTLTFVVNSDNPALFSAGPAVDSTGTLTYTPAANANGSATVTIHVQDNGGTANGGVDVSPTQTFVITVTAVNDVPSFTKGADDTVLEDSGPRSVPNWATSISAGPPDESGQTLTFVVANDNNGLFSVQPAVASNGTLTYTPAANAYGTATVTIYLMDNGGTANGGDDTSDSQTFTIAVLPVNDAPSFTKGADQTVLEDAGPQTVTGWATAISAGPANESSQTVSFVVTSGNPSLFSSGPAVDSAGTLTYTPAANANGSATVTIYAQDNGGTANGGVDISPTQTFVINVTAVNDPPTFTKGADQTVLEDSGAHTVAGWATAISAGPSDESMQTVTFLTSNDNPTLFSAQPAVASNGTLTYALAPNAFGSTTVTVTAKDDGGTLNGGVDTSAAQTFTITVTPINDAPSFTKGADQTVLEDAGPQTVTAWATAISAGPNESGVQTVQFQVTSNTNPTLFSVGPSVASNGMLTYTPVADANGSATITIVLEDDGGTANGGVDTSAPQTFVVNVTAVNDTPTFTAGADQTVAEDSGPQTVMGWATSISAGPADESGQMVSFLTSNNNPALFSVQPSVAPNGTLTYTSAPNAFGSATVTVAAKDNGGTANGGADTSTAQTFTITVTSVNDIPAGVTIIVSPASINENSAVTVSGGFTDPDVGDTHTVTIYWGDGTNTLVPLAAGTFTYYASHQYLDDNPTNTAADTYPVYVTVTDNGSPQGVGSTPAPVGVTVSNLAPVISSVSGPTGPQSLGTSVSVTAAFTDVGSQDTHTCTVTWDDTTTSYGTVTETGGNGSCSASHQYAGAGVYSVKVTVKDDDTGAVTKALDSDYIVIFDPSGGFVTGGGWINSPAGASVDYPTAIGKANFGFVSKYRKGSNTPEGETEFQFKAGDLNFHSSAYDYGSLVISGGKAQYRGTGEVNGVAGYRFVLTAYDGQGPGGGGIDRFRIKITRNGSVVYDNRMGVSEDMDLADPIAIAGGSIVIHK
jgi:VCBS repeat-containing protein